MPVNVSDVLSRASKALSDVANVRWTTASKLEYFNDGLLEIAIQKPTAFSSTVVLDLAQGTLQTIPPEYANLIRVVRNITSAAGAPVPVGGRVVSPARLDILNNQFLDWHNPINMPYSRTVQHVCADEFEPRKFYVFPGNDGTGRVEAIMALIPLQIATAGPSTTAPIDQTYFNALADYVAYRCYAEDMILNNAPPRAQAHYQLFQAALGIKTGTEGAANVNTTNKGA